jgi:hypothetical protein
VPAGFRAASVSFVTSTEGVGPWNPVDTQRGSHPGSSNGVPPPGRLSTTPSNSNVRPATYERLVAERNRMDGMPTAADIRRAATRRQQLRGLVRAPDLEVPEVAHINANVQ